MENLLPLFLLATLGGIGGLLGGTLLLITPAWAQKISTWSIPFAGGVLLSVSFLDLLPEAIENSSAAVAASIVLLTIVCAFLFEELLAGFHHCEGRSCSIKTSLPLVVLGDTIHNFVDGTVIAAAFLTNPGLGVVVALAAFLHETPHELGDFGLMLAGGWTRTKAILVNFASASATYAGAFLVIIFSGATGDSLGVLLAIASGLFIYIATTDLLPKIEERLVQRKRLTETFLFLLGVLLMWIVTSSI